jgi:hypothetical protein
MAKRVAVYIRRAGSREYELASPRALYPSNVVFCLRYTQQGKRKWETLDVNDYKKANLAAQKKSVEL